MVASLDGAIAVDGRSGGLGGDADLRLFRILRSLADVVLVAAGTVRSEMYGPPKLPDELIAARLSRGQPRLPRLAVVSRSLQLDWGSRLFAEADPDARPLVVTCAGASPQGLARAATVAEVVVAGGDTVDLHAALLELGARGAGSVLCEGGPLLNSALAAGGLLDELCLTVAAPPGRRRRPPHAGRARARPRAASPCASTPPTRRRASSSCGTDRSGAGSRTRSSTTSPWRSRRRR